MREMQPHPVKSPDATEDPALARLVREIGEFERDIAHLKVTPQVDRSEIRAWLEARSFDTPDPLDVVVDDVIGAMRAWNLQTTHPRYFGLFNPSTHRSSVVADALTALYNPQVAAYAHSPIANEIERYTLEALIRLIGWDPSTTWATFTSGGQEANLTAVLAALNRAYPRLRDDGLRSLPATPRLYVGAEGHLSIIKAAQMLGLGRSAVVTIAAGPDFSMDVEELDRKIRADVEAGHSPFLVIATAGSTVSGTVDPLVRIAEVCRARSLWLHADAAWGGSALLSPKLTATLEGIELADSVTWDAHKWLSVPIGAGMFFSRSMAAATSSFDVPATYVADPAIGTSDLYRTTAQWSRRFIGLRLYMSLRERGFDGYRRDIEHQAKMGDLLATMLERSGWTVVSHSPLAIVCFSHPSIEAGAGSHDDVANRVVERGNAWVSTAKIAGRVPVIRACITSFRTTASDIEVLVAELDAALEGVAGPTIRRTEQRS